MLFPETLFVKEPSGESPRNSEGSLGVCDDGSYFFAWSAFTGGSRDHSSAHIAGMRSIDKGKTWSDPMILFAGEGKGNMMSVSILRLATGEDLFFYGVRNAWDDLRFRVRCSQDNFGSFGDWVYVTPTKQYHVINNDRAIQCANGRILIPAAWHPCVDGTAATWHLQGISFLLFSDDHGKSWKESQSRLEGPEGSETGLQEPGVVELSDGRLYMWMRTDRGVQYESFSSDGGETWSSARPSQIVSPISPATIRRIPGTTFFIMVWNDHSGRHPFPAHCRSPLCVAVSRDDCRSWSPSIVIEDDPEGWYCYTSLAFDDDMVILSYCAGDSTVGGLNRLKIVRFSLSLLLKIC
ncbi:MAG: sialidase family protein [Candidatus Ratteibacteria bacterium]|jgi:sialidase-1